MASRGRGLGWPKARGAPEAPAGGEGNARSIVCGLAVPKERRSVVSAFTNPRFSVSSAPPTIRQIAEACGCSSAAVSYALRDNPKVSPAVRARVQRIARKLGWRPNPLVSAYMAHFRSVRPPGYKATLGFLLSNPGSGRIGDQPMYRQRHYDGARKRASALGYQVETIWLHEPHMSSRRLNSVLGSRNIPGLLVPARFEPADLFEGIDWAQFASVVMGFSASKSRLHRLAADTCAGFVMMLEKARALGYRRIGVVASEDYGVIVNQGIFYAACYLRDRWIREQVPCEILLYHFPSPDERERPGIAAWLKQHRPDVVLGEDIAWKTICELGWRIPQDVAFMSVDWSPEFPLIGGMNQHHELHGALAVDIVVGQVNQNQRGLPAAPGASLVPCGWEDGLSIPPKAEIRTIKRSANR